MSNESNTQQQYKPGHVAMIRAGQLLHDAVATIGIDPKTIPWRELWAHIQKHPGVLFDLFYQCPQCGSENCSRIHRDTFVGTDIILCGDCDEEFTVDADTDIPSD